MAEPIKNNTDILNDQQAFLNAYDRAREIFGKIEGVAGVGFGQKHTSGEFINDVAIVVFVNEKKSEDELPPEQRIPPTFEGYRTDVRLVIRANPAICDNTNRYEVIQGGIQIQSKVDAAGIFLNGTLGCIVKKRGDTSRDNVYLLSNKHVLYAKGAGAGDYIFHPFCPPAPGKANPGPQRALGPIQSGAIYGNVTATVPDATPGTTVSDTFFIDCAIARIDIDCKCWGTRCTKDDIKHAESVTDLQLNGVDTLSDVRSIARDLTIVTLPGAVETGRPRVFKVGRTTGRTRGIVRGINATVIFPGDPTVSGSTAVTGQNMIEITFDLSSAPANCKGNTWFAEEGDSGSILVDENNRVIGLVTGVPRPGDPPTASAAASHILPVLDQLHICVPVTTGTSHGSSKATDGSGLVAVPNTPSADELVDGQFVFASQSPASMPARSVGFPDPEPLSSEELDHMHQMLDTFNETEKGRELYEAFALLRREIGYLIRNCRPVKVAWHRNQGPAFFAHFLNHLKGHTDEVPREIKGISQQTLLTCMIDVLRKHGSNPLRQAIEQYSEEFMELLSRINNVHDCLAYLRQKENA